jgi:hypothetical protein
MADRIRFHLDENCPTGLADGLRAHGFDVTTTAEAGLLNADDAEQFAFAAHQDRVMVTFDADFTRMHAAGVEHAGIAFCPSRRRSVGQLIRRLQLISVNLGPHEMRNRLEFI